MRKQLPLIITILYFVMNSAPVFSIVIGQVLTLMKMRLQQANLAKLNFMELIIYNDDRKMQNFNKNQFKPFTIEIAHQ